MALTYSWPGPTTLATTTDGRKALAGLIVKSSAGVPRSGIFPRHTNALVAARADMNLDVGIFEAVGVQFGGPVFFTNDATAQLSAALVSPGAGITNYYVVYSKQNESAAPGTDANNNRVLTAQLSTTSFAVARAALPTGAVELATVEMPTGKTGTNGAGVIITQTFQYTATAGGVVLLRNGTEETAWTPADGGIAYRLDLAQFRYRIGGQWRASRPASLLGEWHVNIAPGSPGGVAMGPGGVSTFAIAAEPYARAIRVTVQGGAFLSATGAGGLTCTPSTGAWAGGTNQHRVSSATIGYFTGLSYVFYMTSLAASTALTLTLASDSTVTCGYDLHFTVEEI